jgi:hypothetical protein
MNLRQKRTQKPATAATKSRRTWPALLRRRARRHDPMLVLSMCDFNFAGGWERILNPIKSHENGI